MNVNTASVSNEECVITAGLWLLVAPVAAVVRLVTNPAAGDAFPVYTAEPILTADGCTCHTHTHTHTHRPHTDMRTHTTHTRIHTHTDMRTHTHTQTCHTNHTHTHTHTCHTHEHVRLWGLSIDFYYRYTDQTNVLSP